MKKSVLLAVGIFAFALLSARAQIIYSTYNDWTNWNGGNDGVTAISTFDYDGVTTNGLGNPQNAGGTSIGGSLQFNPATPGSGAPYIGGSQNYTWGPGPTTAFLQAMDGPAANYGGSLVAQSGTILVNFTMPDHTTAGTYFQLGVWLNYSGGYVGYFSTSQIDLGPVSTPTGPMEMYQAVIPYSLTPCSLGYFQFAIVENTDYQGVKPWYVDSVSVVPLVAPPTPPPVTSLFTTSNDFALFTSAGGDLVQATNDWSFSNDATNGLGNTNAAAPGAIGTPGSLLLYWSSLETGYGTIAQGPDEEYNAAFMQAIDPGCDPGSETSVAAYGNLHIDFSFPDNTGGGNYFQLGVDLSYAADGYYQTIFSTATKDLHVQDNNGDEVYEATIPYNINAGNFYGFSLSVTVNSNYQPVNGFHIGNISVSAASAPVITSVSLKGANLVVQGTNALGGEQFALLASTNLALPITNWTAVGAGVFSGPMTFSNTFSINPANRQLFYRISVP